MSRKRKQILRKRTFRSRREVTLVGPLKVHSGILVCPSCDDVTKAHVVVAAAVLGAYGRVRRPALVSGRQGLSEPVLFRLRLIAQNSFWQGAQPHAKSHS